MTHDEILHARIQACRPMQHPFSRQIPLMWVWRSLKGFHLVASFTQATPSFHAFIIAWGEPWKPIVQLKLYMWQL